METKYVNVTVSTSISTDFILEVPVNTTEEQIKEMAKKEIVLPIDYPKTLDNFLKTKMGITVQGMDSMLRSWNVDEIKYVIE